MPNIWICDCNLSNLISRQFNFKVYVKFEDLQHQVFVLFCENCGCNATGFSRNYFASINCNTANTAKPVNLYSTILFRNFVLNVETFMSIFFSKILINISKKCCEPTLYFATRKS